MFEQLLEDVFVKYETLPASLIAVCREESRGVNCRKMATILNECYLAMGMKSRHVTCMPGEENFDDCHVINAVFSNELNKWLWIEPTFEAYVMNENGEMLSIQEVRDRLISGEPLVLNENANWNNKEKQTKEYYLDEYMAKIYIEFNVQWRVRVI